MKNGVRSAAVIASSVLVFVSCKKDDVTTIPEYTVPTTYNFDNVNYSEAAARVSQWAGFTGYLGRSTSRRLSQDTATFMWNNTNAAYTAETTTNLPLSTADINASTFNLSGKASDAATFKMYTDSMVNISQYYSAVAAPGVPGKIGNRLFNHTGVEFNQLVAKGLMGALFLKEIYAQLDKSVTDDNSTVLAGSGTAMQHSWDMAFGYLAIPKTYDTSVAYPSTDPARPLGLGGYLKERGTYIKAGGTVFQAFLKGRAAIGANDYAGRDAAIATIKEILEKTLAAAAYAYVTNPQTTTDLASKFHGLSEGYGFALALKYRRANSPLTEANYQTLLSIIKTDFYELAADPANTKLKQAQGILTTAFGQLQQ